jgi:hypothetical protein
MFAALHIGTKRDYQSRLDYFWFLNFFAMLIELSGIATCFLCALRAISINWPLYEIHKVKVYMLFVLAVVYIVAGKLIMCHRDLRDRNLNSDSEGKVSITLTIAFCDVNLMIVSVVICSVISVRALQRTRPEVAGQRLDGNNKATKMVLILGLLFVTFNSIWVSFLTYFLISDSQDQPSRDRDKGMLKMVTYITMSINSAVNPIVYMTRNEEMKKYIKQSLCKAGRVISGLCSSDNRRERFEPEIVLTAHSTIDVVSNQG